MKGFEQRFRRHRVHSFGEIVCILGVGFYLAKDCVERHSFPMRAELRPSRHTVQINRNVLAGQLPKRFPIPSSQKIRSIIDRKLPFFERNVRSRPAERTGKSVVRYCPGGSFTSATVRLPKKPRETVPIRTPPMRERPNWLKSQSLIGKT